MGNDEMGDMAETTGLSELRGSSRLGESSELRAQRQFFAEEVQTVANVRTPALVEAFARVPREGFLGPGPWLIRGEGDFGAASPRRTIDADPRRILHNVVVAIDPARHLFNGQPSTLAVWIDALGLRASDRVLHVGCGLGYYTALMAECVGETGKVVAVEVDSALAARASEHLARYGAGSGSGCGSSSGSVDVRCGNGVELDDDPPFDAIMVNAGMTHPHDAWLQALKPGGRLVLPLTCAFPQAGPTIGKGIVLLITRGDGNAVAADSFAARVLTFVAIYSAQGIRDSTTETLLGQAMRQNPFPSLTRLRRDPHDPSSSCWLHTDGFCLSA